MNQTKLKNNAFLLAVNFSDESDLPSRLKKQNSRVKRNSKLDTNIEKRLKLNCEIWESTIINMNKKLERDLANRFITLKPVVPKKINTVTDCPDFLDFIDYLSLRRDFENCNKDELGCLVMLLGAFQKKIEESIIE